MRFTIKAKDIISFNNSRSGEIKIDYPKYTSQIINLANQNAQGTRPKVVGTLSQLFPEYERETSTPTISGWREWYTEKYPDALDEATNKIYAQIENLKEAIVIIDKDLVRTWVEDLVITKTFSGLYLQQIILAKIAELTGEEWRLASPEEESKGIDGYVGSKAYSIKPDSYDLKKMLPEEIEVTLVVYSKSSNGKDIDIEIRE